MADQRPNKRRKIRFAPEVFTSAEVIGPGGQKGSALVLDESFQGARLLLPKSIGLKAKDKIQARVGELDSADAVVRWVDLWDKQNLLAVGIEYLNL